MKKILLFVSIVFFLSFQSETNAQTIDSIQVTQYIDCNNSTQSITVWSALANPPNAFSYVIQYENCFLGNCTWQPYINSNPDISPLSSSVNSFDFDNLSGNSYRVYLVDASWSFGSSSGILDSIYFSVTGYIQVQINLLSVPTVDILCAGDCDAERTVQIGGGIPGYDILVALDGVQIDSVHLDPFQQTFLVDSLCDGDYTVTVIDTCGDQASVSFTITEPPLLDPGNAAIAVDSITCYDADDGQITLTPSGGTPGYTYEWFDAVTGLAIGNTSNPTGNVLAPGQYYAVITDDNACDTITDTITLFNPPELKASITSAIDPVCNGDNNGSITITIDPVLQGVGGTFQYTQNGGGVWVDFPPATPTQNTFPALPAGLYSNILVRDADQCEYDLPDTSLIEPPVIQVFLSAKDYNGVRVSCLDSCDGEITIDSVTGGNLIGYGTTNNPGTSLPFLGGIAFSGDTIIDSAYCAGNYSFTVTDDLGCDGNSAIFINEPPLFSISTAPLTAVTCPGACDGSVNILHNNGLGPINYSITNNNWYTWSTTASNTTNPVPATGICGFNTNGQDTIVAIDDNGCIDTTYVTLSEPALFAWDMGAKDENCALGNGAAWVYNVTGGTGVYSYSWASNIPGATFPTNDTIENLDANPGTYYVTVTDAVGCSFTDTADVDSTFIKVSPIISRRPCNSMTNAEIEIATNGVQLSEMVLMRIDNNPGGTGITTLEILTSTYTFNGPGGTLIQNPGILTANMKFPDPGNPNRPGSNYTLSPTLDPNIYYELRVELFADNYGDPGCDDTTYRIEIEGPVSMDASLDSTLSFLDLICYGDSTDLVQINVIDSFNILQSPNLNPVIVSLDGPGASIPQSAINPPFNLLTSSSLSLHAGTYSVFIQSNITQHTNCLDTVTFTVNQPDSLQFTLSSDSTSCNGGINGSVYVDTIFGGTAPYNYTWRDAAGAIVSFQDSAFGLAAGWYYLTVTDDAGCPEAIDSVQIFDPTPITASATVLRIDECFYSQATGSYEINALGGTGAPYTYFSYNEEWIQGLTVDTFSSPLKLVPSQLDSGWIYFTVTDGNGCTTLPDSVFIPNGVNPILDLSYVTNVSCFDGNDGSYIAVVDSLNPLGSNSGPFVFLDGPLGNAIPTPQDSLLSAPDSVEIFVRDALNCTTDVWIYITQPDLLQITHFDTLTYIGGYNVSCNGSLDGEFTINAIGGTRSYTYWIQTISTINPSSIDSVFTGLGATYYEAFVIDQNGCLDSSDIYLTQPNELLIDSIILSTNVGGWNVSCLGGDNGHATAYVSGGNLGYAYTWSNGDNTNIADTLSASTYSVVVTDTNGCVVSDSRTLTEPPTALVINSIACNNCPLACKGLDNGTATVSVSGSTPGYTYLWDNANSTIGTYLDPSDTVPSLNDVTPTADTLRAGVYNVGVWDANGCYVTGNVTITEPSISITIDSIAVDSMDCYNFNNASIQIFTTGPQPAPYFYTLYNASNKLDTIKPLTASPSPQGNIAFSGLGSLHHVVYVEDNLGCIDRDTVIIDPLDSVRIDSVIYSNVSCNGYADGYIEQIFPLGGTPPYQYSINGGNTLYPSWICTTNVNTCPTGFVFSGLSPGLYTVEIWDANGCSNSYNIDITEPPAMVVNTVTNNYNNYQIACYGESDEVEFNIIGGIPPYNIAWTDPSSGQLFNYTTQGQYIWSGLFQGVHDFTITSSNNGSNPGCSQTVSVTLAAPPAIQMSPITTDVFCTDSCTGEITAVVSGGVGQGIGTNYTYQWNDAGGLMPNETSYYIDDLCQGTYTLEVTDNNNCTSPFPVAIGDSLLAIFNAQVTDVGCYGDCDGSITVSPIGGVPSSTGSAYSYSWNDPLGQNTQTAIGLCEGWYTVTVTDMAGCEVVDSFYVGQPATPFVVGITETTPILCNGQTGGLTASTGGTGTFPYTYVWSSGPPNISTASNLFAGSYSCLVTDGNGCTDTAHYYLSEPDVLEPDFICDPIDVLCKDDIANGEIVIVAMGGTQIPGIPGAYKYTLNPTGAVQIDSAANFIGLSSGIYTVTVTDENGCSETSDNIFVDEPDNVLSIDIDSYHETCALNDAGATVFPFGGTPPYIILWDSVIDPPGNSASPDVFEKLTPGANEPHTVQVWDDNDCYVTKTINLLGYTNVFDGYQDSYETTICMGEQIQIVVDSKDGHSYLWERISNGDTIGNNATLNVITDDSWLPEEILRLTITDDTEPSCPEAYVYATINIFDQNSKPDATVFVEGNNQGKIVTVLEGTTVTLTSLAPYNYNTYYWTNSSNEELATVQEFSITAENTDWYHLYVTYGSCIGYDSVYVMVGVLPITGITPNGDGWNDDWYIQDLDKYPNSTVQLFNRWGDMLFEYKGVGDRVTSNDYDWESLNVGTYYYIIDLGNGSSPQTGPLTIIK